MTIQKLFPAAPELQWSAHTDAGGLIAGKYLVQRLIGVGGMGVVFSATHLGLERQVAIKVVREDLAQEQSVLQRFVLEAKAAAKISNDHVCKVLDVGQLESGLPFLVMELLEGRDLGGVLEEGQQLDLPEAVDWILQACEGLAHAHALGIVHRDLKPENLFLTQCRDGTACIKILDFGISKQLGRPGDRSITGPYTLVGSPRYMAPEQLLLAGVDERADLWALGAILYELATGAPAFSGNSLPSLCAKVLGEAPVPPRQRNQRVPAALEVTILRCLQRERALRFRHVADLARALAPHGSEVGQRCQERILGLPASHASSAVPSVLASPGRGSWSPAWGARARHAVALTLTVAALGLVLLTSLRSEPARRASPAARVPADPGPPASSVESWVSVGNVSVKGDATARGTPEIVAGSVAAQPQVHPLPMGALPTPPPPAPPQRKHPEPGAPQGAAPTQALAHSAWSPREAWDIRNFGDRQ